MDRHSAAGKRRKNRPGQAAGWHGIDSRRVLHALVSHLDGMVFRCLPDARRTLRFASDGCLGLTGWRAEEMLDRPGRSLGEIIRIDDRATVRDAILAAGSDGTRYVVEYRIRCRDGSEKWVRERGSGVHDESGGRVIEGFIEDVTAEVERRRRLVEAELRFRSIFENSVVGMFQTSADGHYLAANRALAALYGYADPDALIRGLRDIAASLYVDPGRRGEFARRIGASGRVIDFESEVVRADGRRIWISENAHAVHGPDGRLLYYEGTVEEVTERRQYQARLEYQATHDPLTGLPNRNLLEDRLNQAVAKAEKSGERVLVAFVDLDNFKFVNDSLGHAAGDLLLVETGRRLVDSLPDTDTVVRYGGDEFVLILSDDVSLGRAVLSLERIKRAVAQPLTIRGRELRIDCSIGVGVHPGDGGDLQSLLRQADIAMHHAKAQGKGQFQFYTDTLNTAAHERLLLESALRGANERGELRVVYQPKVDRDRRPTGFEALLRWSSPEFGAVSPARFIPLAEETGAIVPITDFVLRTACREALRWPEGDGEALSVAVNLSARMFADPALAERIGGILAETGLPAGRLELEITESSLMGDIERTAGVLRAIKRLGVSIAIDDFGTGYSSLAYLNRLPVDVLKIDRSFVTGCECGGQAMAIPRAVISLGHGLRMRIVAEGIETPGQMAVLAAQGCEEFQGYMIARPLAAEAVVAFLHGEHRRDAEERA